MENQTEYRIGIAQPYGSYATAEYGIIYHSLTEVLSKVENTDYIMVNNPNACGRVFYRVWNTGITQVS